MTASNRLSQIDTIWSIVYLANRDGHAEQEGAQAELLERYGPAISRYLASAVRDANAAEDLYQEFAVKFLSGDFAKAHEEKGRFRGFLKVVLGRMVTDYFRRQIRRPTSQLDPQVAIPDDREQQRRDQEFLTVWSDQMLTQAWQRLGEEERETGKPWMQVLKFRVEHPQARSAELAQMLAETLGEPVTATRLRVMLHRAREKFSEYLIGAVADTLRDASLDTVEQELAELGLLRYCQATIDHRRRNKS
jgi:RNA polymerase sigma factor (sigma-70 family)